MVGRPQLPRRSQISASTKQPAKAVLRRNWLPQCPRPHLKCPEVVLRILTKQGHHHRHLTVWGAPPPPRINPSCDLSHHTFYFCTFFCPPCRPLFDVFSCYAQAHTIVVGCRFYCIICDLVFLPPYAYAFVAVSVGVGMAGFSDTFCDPSPIFSQLVRRCDG